MIESYNAETNTFTIPVVKEKADTIKSRAFIVNFADSQDEADSIQRGEVAKFNISPILASSEKVALAHIQGMGKVPISIVPLEMLEMQVNLLYELAKNEKIELIRENLFKVSV